MPEFLKGAYTLLTYDVKLLSESCDVKCLQRNLDRLLTWAVTMDLHFDPVNCENIHVGKSLTSNYLFHPAEGYM